ncbi:hypothetical protein MMC25_001372 [Agyrium rufum]|nr:hypothetical protein [Agyrium rufum]
MPGGAQCQTYQVPQIPWTPNVNASCPFASGICYYGDTAAFSMDTGFIDSHDILGLNAPKNGRILFRKATTCAPLRLAEYVVEVNETESEWVDSITYEYLGSSGLDNFTWKYDAHSLADTSSGYQLFGLEASAQYNTFLSSNGINIAGWVPSAQLNRTDADESLFFLSSNTISYPAPVDDPVFSAHLALTFKSEGTNITTYEADYYFGAIACAEQAQICNPTNDACTPLTGQFPLNDATFLSNQTTGQGLGLSDIQSATALRVLIASVSSSIYRAVASLSSAALRATDTVATGQFNIQLPSNQWQVEVVAWFSSSLAHIQAYLVELTAPSPVSSSNVSYLTSFTPDDISRRKPEG